VAADRGTGGGKPPPRERRRSGPGAVAPVLHGSHKRTSPISRRRLNVKTRLYVRHKPRVFATSGQGTPLLFARSEAECRYG
jgi:hypothetical protein